MLIILEGIDGAGKTTWIKKNYPDAIVLKEDTNSEEWKIAIDDENIGAMLALRLHVQFYEKRLKKSLDAGSEVVIDRFWPSTLAYQKINTAAFLKEFHDHLDFLISVPHKVILIDTPQGTCLKRIESRGEALPNLSTLKKVRNKYLKLAKKFNWEIIRGCN